MTNAVTAIEPEKSLWERVKRTGNLLNQGVESMVYGTLSLPALVADGYLDVYRAGREALGGEAFKESDMYARSKQGLTDWGRKMDGSYGKVVGAQDATEQKIVFGAELVTGLVGPGAIKSLKTLAEGKALVNGAATVAAKPAATAATATADAAKTASASAAAPTVAKTKLATANEDVLSALSKAKAEGEAARAGATVAKTADAAGDTAKAGVTAANTAAKAEYGYSEVLKIVKREKDLAGRLESLSGHGPRAEAMVDRMIAGARKTGVSGDDWAAIKNSRSLPQSVIDRVGKIRDDHVNSAWGVGPAWEKAKGTAAYWKEYPLESAARLVAAPVSVPFKMAASAVANHTGKAALLGTGVAAYYGVNYLADSPDPTATTKPAAKTESAAPTRDVPLEEALARNATDTAIFISKLSMTSALTLALNAASKIPGLGTMALNSARGSAQSLVQEIADGEPDINKAWDVSQEKLNKILPGAHMTALGEFVKGKSIEDMSEENRTRVSDALTAITQPNSEKARTFRGAIVAEAKQKAEQAGQAVGLDVGGDSGADNEMDDGMKNMLGQFLNIDPKNLNARNVARMMRNFAGDNKMALGLGLYAAYSAEGGPLKKAVVGLVTTMVMSFLMPHLMQMFGPMIKAAGPALTNMRDQLGQKFDQASTTGQFNTGAYGLKAPDAVPVQKQAPVAEAANDPVADFRNNSNLMTNPVTDVSKRGINPAIPAANRDQFALSMNG
jgi:hypothetical protein